MNFQKKVHRGNMLVRNASDQKMKSVSKTVFPVAQHDGEILGSLPDAHLDWMVRTMASKVGKRAKEVLDERRRSHQWPHISRIQGHPTQDVIQQDRQDLPAFSDSMKSEQQVLASFDIQASADRHKHFAFLLKSCGNAKDLTKGKRVHASILDSEHRGDNVLTILLLQMYGKCGSLQDARRVFDGIDQPSVCLWTNMTTAYAQNGLLDEAQRLFDSMPEHDLVSWNAMVTAYGGEGKVEDAKATFDKMPEWDVLSWNALITAYAVKGHLEEAKSTFDKMPQRNVVSWTAVIQAFAQDGHLEEAEIMFNRMPEWNVVTWTAILQAYAQNGHLDAAKSTFGKMPERNVITWTVMLQGYAQNGQPKEAKRIFDTMPELNVIGWTAMLATYAHLGYGRNAIKLFQGMELEGIKPNEISFLSVLIACNHIGMVHLGRRYFVSMVDDYEIQAWIDHYCSMVDILGRAGQLENAEDLINEMPYVANVVAWGALLGAAQMHQDMERGNRAAKHLFKLDPKKAARHASWLQVMTEV